MGGVALLKMLALLLIPIASCATDAPPADGDSLVSDSRFWKHFEIDGQWAEFYPTLVSLSDGADAVVSARVTGIELAIVTQGQAAEDVVFEAGLKLGIVDTLSGAPRGSSLVTLVLPNVVSNPQAQALIAELNRTIPEEPAVFLLRARDAERFRVVNGHGLWARTTRRNVDAPLIPEGVEDGVFAAELAGVSTLSELVAKFRRPL